MKGNFERCLAITLAHEGGWADQPEDPGGATMKGITLATYRIYRLGATKADLRAISDAEVSRIYRQGYWDAVRGDDLPAGIDLVAFDAAVNSGPSRGAIWLQRALGVYVDGKIGPQTVAKASCAGSDVINAACDHRLAFLRSLKTWLTFGKGWARRVAEVRAAALAMASAESALAAEPKPATPVRGWIAAILCFLKRIFGGAK